MSNKLLSDAQRSPNDIETIQELGRRASEYAKRLVEGKSVELRYDIAHTKTDHKGSYGRLLAHVWVLDYSGNRQFMINRRMIRDGYDKAYTWYPF